MSDNPSGKPTSAGTPATGALASVTYKARKEEVVMNKYHLKLAIRRMKDRRKGPTLEQAAIPLTIAISMLYTLLTTSFKKFASVPPATWQALTLMALIASLAVFSFLFGSWLYCLRYYPPKSDDEEYDEIIREMNAETERIEAIEREANGQA